MSTKVSYKGEQIAEVGTQQTKTLLTAGKYCEDDFTLANDDNPVVEENDVIFIDYDGTIRYSYSADEFLALTALPPNPVHAGLTAQGWNWTLAEMQNYTAKYKRCLAGQMYITADGATRIYIYIDSDVPIPFTLYFSQTVNYGITFSVDDGRSSWTVEGTGNLTTTFDLTGHREFCISILPAENCSLTLGHGGTTGIFGNTENNSPQKFLISKVSCGKNLTLNSQCFRTSRFKTISISDGTNFASYIFGSNDVIAVVVPRTGNTSWWITYSSGANFVVWPGSKNYINEGLCYHNSRVKRVIIPDGVSSIATTTFAGCHSIESIVIPDTVTTIAGNSISSQGLIEITFFRTTPATLSASNSVTGSEFYRCSVFVPFSALATYLAATNYPSASTYTYIGFATYASGVTLPTQDSTEAYNVAWYTTKADAIAQTNAITEGIGKEIYCRYAAVT